MITERCTSFGTAALLCTGGLLLTASVASAGDVQPAIWYVDDDAPDDSGKGTSWGDPFRTIDHALAAAAETPVPDIIRVAQGTYVPGTLTDPKDPRSRTILIDQPDVEVLGGYAGPGLPHPDWRKPVLFPTIIDGAPKPSEGLAAQSPVTTVGMLNLPLADVPDILSGFISADYDAATQVFTATGVALELDLGGPTPLPITGGTMLLSASIDNDGVLTGGEVSFGGWVDGRGPVLLEGELVLMGFEDNGGTVLEFLGKVVAGDLAPGFGGVGANFGVVLNLGQTGFNGDWTLDINTGPIGLAGVAPSGSALAGDVCEDGDGDCYEPNGTPGCDNTECCDLVCGLDSFCCDVEWDLACAEFAGVFCELPGPSNAYHVVTIIGGGPEVVFDGFTLTGGDAHDAEIPGGGGMLIINSDASVGRVVFTQNTGALGGALAIETEGPDGAARPFLYNLWFDNNEASDRGGAIYNMGEPTIVNTVVVSNTARGTSFLGAGGGIFNGGLITLANSTVGWNLAENAVGGGVRNNPFGGVQIVNSILWSNEDAEGDAVTAQVSGGTIFVDYSNVQDGAGSFPEGQGNIASTPGFINPPFQPGGELTGGDGEIDLGLLPISPCIDAGSNSLVPLDIGNLDHDFFDGSGFTEQVPLDLHDQLRFVDNLKTPDQGEGKENITDMGAVEFPTVLGDLTGDGYVAPRDLAILLAAWGLCPGPGCIADLTIDGLVFEADLATIIQNWNPPRGMAGLEAPKRDEIELPR